METIEGNELISKFMKEKLDRKQFGSNWERIINEIYPDDIPKYHESWDWLMPVVEKIEQLGNFYCSVIIKDSICIIVEYDGMKEKTRVSREGGKKIECTWQAVVAFIQWYNRQIEFNK